MATIIVKTDNGEVIDKIQIPAEFEYSPVMKEYYAYLINIDINHALRLDADEEAAKERVTKVFGPLTREEEPNQ